MQADRVLHPLSRYLTGACIEDVNHEIYGGIYSQMVFGESFQEPPPRAQSADKETRKVSGMWRSVQTGSADRHVSHRNGPSLRRAAIAAVTFTSGEGRVGIENRGRTAGECISSRTNRTKAPLGAGRRAR